MMEILTLTDEDFSETIFKEKKPVLVDFWSSWCEPCRFLSPILEKVAKEFKEEIVFVKVNIDDSPLTTDNYQVHQIPTVMIFKKGKPVSFFIGIQPEGTIRKWLEENIR